MIIKVLLWINISLFILHEMDAVKTREWKMMIFINRLNDDHGHIVFTAFHFFIFIIIFYLSEFHPVFFAVIISFSLIIHQFVHILFTRHNENRMNNFFSVIIISLMSINSVIILFYYFIIM